MRHWRGLSSLIAPFITPLLSHRLTVARSTLRSFATSDAFRYAFIKISIAAGNSPVKRIMLHMLQIEYGPYAPYGRFGTYGVVRTGGTPRTGRTVVRLYSFRTLALSY